MTIEEDVAAVQEALGELSTYGEHASQSPLDLPAVGALDRIVVYVEELERAATSWGSDLEANFDRVRDERNGLREERDELRRQLNTELEYGGRALAEWQRENDELLRRVSRLRKAVTWLAGAVHEKDDPLPHSGATFHDCEVWECMRAKVVLDESRAALQRTEGDG